MRTGRTSYDRSITSEEGEREHSREGGEGGEGGEEQRISIMSGRRVVAAESWRDVDKVKQVSDAGDDIEVPSRRRMTVTVVAVMFQHALNPVAELMV